MTLRHRQRLEQHRVLQLAERLRPPIERVGRVERIELDTDRFARMTITSRVLLGCVAASLFLVGVALLLAAVGAVGG